jgi:acetoacetate decarboxylase
MPLKRTMQEIMQIMGIPIKIYGDSINIFYETSPEAYKNLLPPPLVPFEKPIIWVFFGNVKKTTFTEPLLECSLFMLATYEGKPGFFSIAFVTDDDMSFAGGRENYGYPKKMGILTLKEDNKESIGTITRHKIQFAKINIKWTGKPNLPEAVQLFETYIKQRKMSHYQFMPFPEPSREPDKMHINLLRINLKTKADLIATGEAEVKFTESKFDSWSELPVVKMLGAFKTRGEIEFADSNAVKEVETPQVMPITIGKYDAQFPYFFQKYNESK